MIKNDIRVANLTYFTPPSLIIPSPAHIREVSYPPPPPMQGTCVGHWEHTIVF